MTDTALMFSGTSPVLLTTSVRGVAAVPIGVEVKVSALLATEIAAGCRPVPDRGTSTDGVFSASDTIRKVPELFAAVGRNLTPTEQLAWGARLPSQMESNVKPEPDKVLLEMANGVLPVLVSVTD